MSGSAECCYEKRGSSLTLNNIFFTAVKSVQRFPEKLQWKNEQAKTANRKMLKYKLIIICIHFHLLLIREKILCYIKSFAANICKL